MYVTLAAQEKTRDGAVVWGTALQARRSPFRYPIKFFVDLLFLYVNSIANKIEYQGCLLWGKAGRSVGLNNLVHSRADYLKTLKKIHGALSRPLMGYI